MVDKEKETKQKAEHIDVEFVDLTDIDPTKIEGGDPNMDYRNCNQRLMEIRKRQGYVPVDAEKEGVKTSNVLAEPGKSADTTLKYMDTVLCKRPKEYAQRSEQRKTLRKEEMARNLKDWIDKANKNLMSHDERKMKQSLEELNALMRVR